MVCVRPGVLLVNASRFCPTSALIALDLPTFERPAKAISGGPGGGKSLTAPLEAMKLACENAFIGRENSNKIAPFVGLGFSAHVPVTCVRRARRDRLSCPGAGRSEGSADRGPGVRELSRRRRQQRRRGQSQACRPVSRVPRQTARRFQAAGGKER